MNTSPTAMTLIPTNTNTKNMKRIVLLLTLPILFLSAKAQQLTSPNGQIKVDINVSGEQLSYTVYEGELSDRVVYVKDNKIAISFDEMGKNEFRIGKSHHEKEHITAPNYRQAKFDVEYNKLVVKSKNGVNVEFRAYDTGVAYRFFTTSMKEKLWRVLDEVAEFNFSADHMTYLPYSTNEKNPMAMAFQATYDEAPLSQTRNKLAFLPATIDCGKAKVTIMESDVVEYPGMFVQAEGSKLRLHAQFAKYPKTFDYSPRRMQKYVTSQEDFIAQGKGNRTFPWRILGIAHEDKEMPMNNLVYALASPSTLKNTSWIKPGHVAWDWWNDWGITGVNFEVGINNDTYKHYIDFASENHLEYIILDEGWYDPKSGNMLQTIPEINLPKLVEYAKQKNVRIILWCVFNVLDDHLEEICQKYAQMGIAGFKVDCLDRNDQEGVAMTYRIAEACARHHLMLDYHGIYAPNGIQRTWPNVINFEAVFGMEEVKWTKHDEKDMPRYDVTFPFIRGQAGYVDFTPGGMRNATRQDYQPVYSNPMTMGTRCHQMAHYIVHESPLTMLADNPTIYKHEPQCTQFIASLPPVYQSFTVLDGKMGEFIIVVRTDAEGNYYVGGETNWEERDITFQFSDILPHDTSEYELRILTDGNNANRVATDFLMQRGVVCWREYLPIHMASGGGFAMQIRKIKSK